MEIPSKMESARGSAKEPDQSGRETPAKRPTGHTTKTRTKPQQDLLRLLGFSSFRVMALVLVVEVALAWAALTIAVAFVTVDQPMATLWQRVQVLFSSQPTTLVYLLGLAAAIVIPTFLWFHVLIIWVRVTWRSLRDR